MTMTSRAFLERATAENPGRRRSRQCFYNLVLMFRAGDRFEFLDPCEPIRCQASSRQANKGQ